MLSSGIKVPKSTKLGRHLSGFPPPPHRLAPTFLMAAKARYRSYVGPPHLILLSASGRQPDQRERCRKEMVETWVQGRSWRVAPTHALFWASVMLMLSGLLQFGTVWMQSQATYPVPSRVKLLNKPMDAYSWQGDDYPNSLPLDLDRVALTIENSRHYALDSPDADAEYQSMYPGEFGFLRLGPNKRFFGLAMYHQLHCLDSLRQTIIHGANGMHHDRDTRSQKRASVPHAHHCLNYLRQTILCAADLTLEPEVVPGSQEVGEGLGVTHVCQDWSRVHEYAGRNAEEWARWKNRTSTT
ncbi:hypothetical protein HGRIS_012130 [Hohenbuehelia grisea]|uniref:Oxidase ustYa n=1 Tax=Hohenbuehelia grisea TaxID=104357 RepID=A0ABR3IRE8_9AGAR